MDESKERKWMTRDQLQDYGDIIKKQIEEIALLKQQLEKEYERGYEAGIDAEYERVHFRKD
jgi:hypothetical protein